MLLLALSAAASELAPTLVMPSAVRLEAGGGQAAVGAFVTGGATPRAAVTLRGAVGLTDRLALSGALQEPWGGLALGLRYNVVQTDTFRLAPFVFGLVDDDLVTEAPADAATALAAGVGVALEGGGTTFRYDLSLPLVATGIDPLANPGYVPLVGTSLGVTVRVAPRHTVRFGVESLFAPAATWQYAPERWYVQVLGRYSVVRDEAGAHTEVGLRF